MNLQTHPPVDVPSRLIEAIKSLPLRREIEHCGSKLVVSPFDIYTTCPQCGARIKLRSFTAYFEVEDVFDAVFEWMSQPGTQELVRSRREAIAQDRDV